LIENTIMVEASGTGEAPMAMSGRLASLTDMPALEPLISAAIAELQKGFLDDNQIDARRAVMWIDRQLIEDGTYFVVEIDGELAGCGGWSRRATKYGGDHSAGRDARRLDPASEPAKVRAMYTHPAFVRRGVGTLILKLSEDAARAEGFTELELYATLAGLPLYQSYGFVPVQFIADATDGGAAPVPCVLMRKPVELKPPPT
jgi:GNAT superfamily N-acetyltransferase